MMAIPKVSVGAYCVGEYGAGFKDCMAQVACLNPRVDLSQIGLTKRVVDGQLVDAQE